MSYANDRDPRLKRWLIRSIEGLSGRDHYVRLYDIWRSDIIGRSDRVFARTLDLIDVAVEVKGNWPLDPVPPEPIVIVANHPFGIGDGIAVLALAEQLGRPFKVLIHNDLLKMPEMASYSLPISFGETRQAMVMNMKSRNEAVRLLKEGTTIVVFPAGGVATARRGFGRAQDLPWKMFPAKLIQSAHASVLPIYFEGQNGRLFHLASLASMTLRLSLLIGEFRRLSGSTITAHVGKVLTWEALSSGGDRKGLLARLYEAVFSMAPPKRSLQTFRLRRNRSR
nr:lysophospholipid acyltransferase family protein [Rhizobium leguminosarum]